jgi:bifunctional DNA primase/polymerase-like protein
LQPRDSPRGFHEATSDPREVRRLFARARDANGIAVRCDSERGSIVIDVDGPSGRDDLARLARRCPRGSRASSVQTDARRAARLITSMD